MSNCGPELQGVAIRPEVLYTTGCTTTRHQQFNIHILFTNSINQSYCLPWPKQQTAAKRTTE